MAKAIEETNRRRAKQIAYNEANGIDPQPLRKRINDIVASIAREEVDTKELMETGYRHPDGGRRKTPVPAAASGKKERKEPTDRPAAELAETIEELTERMRAAAAELQFEIAARLRDEVSELKRELRQMREVGLR
jgi:excinuclease ABC subunit B